MNENRKRAQTLRLKTKEQLEQAKTNHKKSLQKKVEKLNKEYYGPTSHHSSANNLIYDQYSEFFSLKKENSQGIESG